MNEHVTIRRQGFNSKAPAELLTPSTYKARTIDVPVLNVSLLDLADDGCRYATTELPPHFFCGMPQQQGSAYCSGHHRLCHTYTRDESAEGKRRRNARNKKRFLPAQISLHTGVLA